MKKVVLQVPDVAWTEFAEVERRGDKVWLGVRIEAGGFQRSTSFEMTPEDARALARALDEAAES